MVSVWRRAATPLWWVLAGVAILAVVYVAVATPGPTPATVDTPRAMPSPTPHGDGLSDTHDGYRVVPVTVPTARGPAMPVAFRILAPDGRPATEYEIVHTKPLHLYLVRGDFTGYQHLHPQLVNGLWTTTAAVADGGAYRFYAEFTPKGRGVAGHPTVLGIPFVIPGDTTLHPLPPPTPDASAGPYKVSRRDGAAPLSVGKATVVTFDVADASGTSVSTVEPYLGACAHMSAFDVLSQALTHFHPALPGTGTACSLTFHAQFANRGEYRLFLQFQIAGTVHEAPFTVFVT